MALIGYARVSSKDQNLNSQIDALTAADADRIYTEKASGTAARRADRAELDKMLDYVRDGDVVVTTRLDRLARSLRDLHSISAILEEKSVGLRVLEQQIDTTTAEGRLFFNILGSIGEFETELRKARQREGIEAAKKRPDSPFKGRPPTHDPAEIQRLKRDGLSISEIAAQIGCHRQTVWRLLNAGTRRGEARTTSVNV